MQAQRPWDEVIFDEEIILLKPLGPNYVSFYQKKQKIIVIFHPELKSVVKQIQVPYLNEYSFRDDGRFLFTIQYYGSISIFQLQEDQYVLQNIQIIRPLGFMWNSILFMREELDLNSFLLNQDIDSSSLSDEFDYNSTFGDTLSLQLMDLKGNETKQYRVKSGQETQLFILNKFYLLPQKEKPDKYYTYYHIMINNKPSIKYYVRSDEIKESYQLKYSNYYLTRQFVLEECIYIMTKQQRNCKIIRKIMLSEQGAFGLKYIYNYRKIISFEGHNKVQWIDFWNLKKKFSIRILSHNFQWSRMKLIYSLGHNLIVQKFQTSNDQSYFISYLKYIYFISYFKYDCPENFDCQRRNSSLNRQSKN